MPEYQCRSSDPVTHPTSSSPAALSRGCRPHGQRLTLFDNKMTDNVWGLAAEIATIETSGKRRGFPKGYLPLWTINRYCAVQSPRPLCPPIATAKADSRKRSCLLCP